MSFIQSKCSTCDNVMTKLYGNWFKKYPADNSRIIKFENYPDVIAYHGNSHFPNVILYITYKSEMHDVPDHIMSTHKWTDNYIDYCETFKLCALDYIQTKWNQDAKLNENIILTVTRLSNDAVEHPHAFLMFDSNANYFRTLKYDSLKTLRVGKPRITINKWIKWGSKPLGKLSGYPVDVHDKKFKHLFLKIDGVDNVEFQVRFNIQCNNTLDVLCFRSNQEWEL